MYNRRDNLARHYRAKHPDSVADASTGRVPSDPVTTTHPALDSFASIDPRLLLPTVGGVQSSELELYLSTEYHSSESELDLSTAPTSIDAADGGDRERACLVRRYVLSSLASCKQPGSDG